MPLSTAPVIDAIVKESTANPYYGLPRLAVMVADSKEVLYSSASGYTSVLPPYSEDTWQSHLTTAEKATTASIFDLWSATKLVAVIAALQLVERGLIKVDDDASQYVKELKDIPIFKGWTEDDKPILEKNTVPITVEMLINQTAGFTSGRDPLFAKYIEQADIIPSYSTGYSREEIAKFPLKNVPGEHFHYGTNNDWLTVVVEEVSGLSIEDYEQKYIFKPLGITDMTYLYRTSKMSMVTTGKTPLDPPSPPSTFSPGHDFKQLHDFGGCGLSGSADSYLKITQAILNGGLLPTGGEATRILKKETVDSMFRPSLKSETQRQDFSITHKNRSEPWSRYRDEPFPDLNWGYGGFLSGTDFPSGRKKGSLSWSGAMSTYWVIDRESDITFLVWSNLWPYASDLFFDVWEKIEPEIYKGLEERKKKSA